MTSLEEELIDQVLAAIELVNGAPPFRSDLRGLGREEDTTNVVRMSSTAPNVSVGFDSLDDGDGRRVQELAFNIDVVVLAGYCQIQNLTPQRALLRIAQDIDVAMRESRVPGNMLNLVERRGTNRHRREDGGATENGVTLSYVCRYTDPRIQA